MSKPPRNVEEELADQLHGPVQRLAPNRRGGHTSDEPDVVETIRLVGTLHALPRIDPSGAGLGDPDAARRASTRPDQMRDRQRRRARG